MKEIVVSTELSNQENYTIIENEYLSWLLNNLNTIFSRSSQNLLTDLKQSETDKYLILTPYNSMKDLEFYKDRVSILKTNSVKIIFRNYFSNSRNVGEDLKLLNSIALDPWEINIQELDFSLITCYPFNFAMSRSIKLLKKLNLIRKTDSAIGSSLPSLLIQFGFEIVKSNHLTPFFIDERQRESLAILFEEKMKEAERNNLIIENERIALIAEVSSYLSKMQNLVSLPRTIQIKAKKKS